MADTFVGQDRKNALEEYVYDTRGKLDDRYAHFVQAAEKEKLLVVFQEAEDWLYTDEVKRPPNLLTSPASDA